jgi:hypothetical protein
MEPSQPKWPIYIFITCCLVWLIFVLYRIFDSDHIIDATITDTIIPTNNIITNNTITSTKSLPEICTTSIKLLNCIINKSKLSWDQEAINEYYQKLISERNTINDKSTLEPQCTKQYNYILSLNTTWYQQIILSCSQ